jgi:hypothetical protein
LPLRITGKGIAELFPYRVENLPGTLDVYLVRNLNLIAKVGT